MADAGELLRDAQYAFYNITHGESPDNRKNKARAKSLARKIIRKFPTSAEADQAHQILEKMDPNTSTQSMLRLSEHPFDPLDQHDRPHQTDDGRTPARESADPVNRDWKKLLLELTHIRSFERNVLLVAAFLLVTLLPFGALIIAAMLIFLLGPFDKYHPEGTQETLDRLYVQLDSWVSKRSAR